MAIGQNNFNDNLRESAVDVYIDAGSTVRAPLDRTDFIFSFSREEVQDFERVGDDLVLVLNNGETVRIIDYYQGAYEHALLFGGEGGGVGVGVLAAGALGLGLAGLALAGDGGDSDPVSSPPQVSRPTIDDTAVTRFIGSNSTGGVQITGTGEPNTTVEVDIGGEVRMATVDASGYWSANYNLADLPSDGVYTVTAVATDPNGNAFNLLGPNLDIDTTAPTASPTDGFEATGDVISAVEHENGVDLSGTGEPGATVAVTVNGVTHETTVDPAGNWQVTFAPDELPTGETTIPAVLVTTDPHGNSARTVEALVIDTDPGDLTLSTDPIETDDVINAVERADGVVVHGTATPGIAVAVAVGAASYNVTASPSGDWSVLVPRSDLPTGTQDLSIRASISDDQGNTKTVFDSVRVDTVVDDFRSDIGAVTGDGFVNSAEQGQGVTVSGVVEPGSTVMVQFGSTEIAATVDSLGNWTAVIPTDSIAPGTYNIPISATATDPAGNSQVLSDVVKVDTETSLTALQFQTADDVINAQERSDGVTFSGTSEPGATIAASFSGTTLSAVADSAGNWEITFPEAAVPVGTYNANVQITATDIAGNSANLSESFLVDTQVDTPGVNSLTFTSNEVTGISTRNGEDAHSIYTLQPSGALGAINTTASSDPNLGTELDFGTPILDGTNFVVVSEDNAGNSAATLVVLEDNAGNDSTILHPGLDGFDVLALDLDYSYGSNLVLSDAQIMELTNGTGSLTVYGGADDTLTLSNATRTAGNQTNGNDVFDVYTLDSGATVLVDDDIRVVI
ncbi:T1SS secreted agglutinin RTX [Candidatus Rhodobacter oscarellae]|uniref:T1SS secreted agglutinin RTX n=1 Tax=Candidatus Rhodobacter oscarellae TaxID=1675527 RepID=A0A0J9E6U1_9RHOB|nr:Ig-like domain-containing protein [Candidatus Rhodobacter lobularis]KMW58490.1 T1SS secreted agglutinin RTX [Candidatus Rhodobacter lobularis]